MEGFFGSFATLGPFVFAMVLALSVHEWAHAWVADSFGDPTPRAAGRLTLNPLAHLDIVGTLVFVFTRFIGWAKPVPVNPAYFRNPRKGMLWVSAAGPLSNLALAAAMGVLFRLLMFTGGSESMPWLNGHLETIARIAYVSVLINVSLAIFNLIPLPPLDGSKVLGALLPADALLQYRKVERWGILILIVAAYSGVVGKVLSPVVRAATSVFLGA